MSIHRTISITTLSTNQNSSLLFSSGQRHGWRISFLVRIFFLSPRFNQSKYFISHSTSTLVIIPCSYKVLNKISPSKSYILTISNPDFPGHFFFCILHVSIPPYSPLMSLISNLLIITNTLSLSSSYFLFALCTETRANARSTTVHCVLSFYFPSCKLSPDLAKIRLN